MIEMCEWNVALYELALEALDSRVALAAARVAIGEAWLISGDTLADAIVAKTKMLEALGEDA